MAKPINIVMFSMSHYTDWQRGRVNRNYHILNQLQQDDRIGKIVTVDFLPFNWHKAAKIYLENIIWPMRDLEIVYGDLTSACHRVNESLYVYSTVDSIYSHNMVVHEIQRIVKVLNLDNVVFWSYNPLFHELLHDVAKETVDRRAFVFDAVDNWLEHPAFRGHERQLRHGYDTIAKEADLVFTVSESLQKTLFANRTKPTYRIANGIDPLHFKTPATPYAVPSELANLPRPILGYHGVIEGRVDTDLIREIAKRNPKASVVLIGAGIWRSHRARLAKELGGLPNIHLLPFVPYQQLPQYLHAFDVAIVPHKVNAFTRSMDPMKFYEYTAAGKPVVTTPVEGMDTFRNVFYVAKTADEFNKQIALALREDSPALRQTRQEVVADDSWQGRVELMIHYLDEVLG